MPDAVLTYSDAEALVVRVFLASGVSQRNAESVARALVAAEVDGQAGHGLFRVASYAAQAQSGKVVGTASPVIEQTGTARIDIDACNGFAFPAIDLAIEKLADLAREAGVAAAAIRRSHHCGQLGAHVERLAERGGGAHGRQRAQGDGSVGGGFIPTLVLGIPGTPPDAVILGTLLVQGVRTGPALFAEGSGIVPSSSACFWRPF